MNKHTLKPGKSIKSRLVEAPLYTAAISLYRFGVRVAALRSDKVSKLNRGQHDVWKRLKEGLEPGSRYIWIHAASLGEFEQGRPLIELLKRDHPEYKILLTFFSPSGYEVRKNYELADCVCYLPFDTPHRVKRFLDMVRPEMAIFVKYEFWRNYLHELAYRNIPTYLISAVFRPEQRFFKSSSKWYAEWLKCFNHIFVQDERSRKLLKEIGYESVSVCGDTRFDRVTAIRQAAKKIPLVEQFRGDSELLVMVGSSWPEDEAVYADWFNNHLEVKLVIAPHEFDDARLQRLRERFRNGAVLMSEAREDASCLNGCQVLIIDCFGLLSSAYAYCDIAYVGGAFGAGLHNINEAAVYDVPVIYGPKFDKFIEAGEMAAAGGGFPVSSKQECEERLTLLTSDREALKRAGNAAGGYIRSKLGATDKIYKALFG